MNYYLLALKKYAAFTGRATRSEYWYFFLINFLIGIVFQATAYWTGDTTGMMMPAYYLYCLAVFIPSLSVCARRLHDIGKSGGMMLIVLIPLAGPIWLLVLLATESSPTENIYGPKPAPAPKV